MLSLPGTALGTLVIVSLWTYGTHEVQTPSLWTARRVGHAQQMCYVCISSCVKWYMYLRAVDGQARSSVQLLVAYVALEVLGLLVVDEHFVIIKLPIAVPGRPVKETPPYVRVEFYIVHTKTLQTLKKLL